MSGDGACAHISAIATVRHPEKRECAECVKMGAQWVHLRTCQECGATLCCDSSPNRHASKHARASGHPVVASAERGERGRCCYPAGAFGEYRNDAMAWREPPGGPRDHALASVAAPAPPVRS